VGREQSRPLFLVWSGHSCPLPLLLFLQLLWQLQLFLQLPLQLLLPLQLFLPLRLQSFLPPPPF
jgi:hypothetical protein